jgi:hypothetical protein
MNVIIYTNAPERYDYGFTEQVGEVVRNATGETLRMVVIRDQSALTVLHRLPHGSEAWQQVERYRSGIYLAIIGDDIFNWI